MGKKTKNKKEFFHCFGPGDLCRNQDGEMYVIIKAEDWSYEFIRLQSTTVRPLGVPPMVMDKGTVGRQSSVEFDKYNYLYIPK